MLDIIKKDVAIGNFRFKNYLNLTEEEMLLVLDWRNNPAIRDMMLNNQPISEASHFRFLKELKTKETAVYWMVFLGAEPIGSIDLYNLHKTVYWGFYLAPELIGGAYGVILEFYVLELVFDLLHLSQLKCETLEINASVLKMHEQFGFVVTDQNKGVVTMKIDKKTWMNKRSENERLISFFKRGAK